MICLLNIVMSVTVSAHETIDRSTLDTQSLETLTESAEAQMERISETWIPALVRMLSHKCTGIDIRKCDPNEPIFYGIPADKAAPRK